MENRRLTAKRKLLLGLAALFTVLSVGLTVAFFTYDYTPNSVYFLVLAAVSYISLVFLLEMVIMEFAYAGASRFWQRRHGRHA